MAPQTEQSTIGKKIRSLRVQSGMTQEDLAKELHVTRQALSNWERELNEPDIHILKALCCKFGLQMDALAMNTLNMEDERMNDEVQRKGFNKYDMAIGLFYAVGLSLGLGIFFVGGSMLMTAAGWTGSLFAGAAVALVFGLLSHAVITLTRKDR